MINNFSFEIQFCLLIPSKGIPKTVIKRERLNLMSEVKQFVSETERY